MDEPVTRHEERVAFAPLIGGLAILAAALQLVGAFLRYGTVHFIPPERVPHPERASQTLWVSGWNSPRSCSCSQRRWVRPARAL